MRAKDNVEETVLQFICSNFMIEADEFNHEESLVDQGVIDSFGLVEISAFLGREFGITDGEESLTRENYGSAKKIIAYAKRNRALQKSV